MNALREEIKETISATIKEKLHSDADSVATVSQSMTTLENNAQYWSDLSNKAAHRSCRALELQLKMAEEKVNILLNEEAPEEVLLEAAWEAHTIHFQLDQNTRLREAGLMPEQNTPALSMTAQLDGAVINRTTEYSGIQQMVRQAIQNASHEAKPEKSFLAKASVKMGNPPLTVVSATSRSSKIGLQVYFDCLTDEAQEWFYRKKWFMLTLSMNKVAVNYDTIMQGSITVQQLHEELTKLAKQMIELPDVYSYRRRFMNALKTDIREQVLKKGFTPEFSIVVNRRGADVRVNPTYGKNPVKLGNTVNKPTQSNPNRNALKANNTVICYNCNQPGHIRPHCPFPDKDRRVAGARIEEVILEEDEDQIEEFDEDVPHPEEQQDWEDQPEEDDQQYCFDEEYETRFIDNEEVRVNAVIKDSGYNDRHKLYGIRVQEAETDLRASAVVQTGGREQPVYDHRARKKAQPFPTRGKENETISVFGIYQEQRPTAF
ncbi:hypothetical protein M422DRAFT_253472 [Sphaerobolus stellatus SS14]|uniref:CCHC-type domain-containing protein n=1 Tax=Sphaerobolus stellatus (strain SS14) TaxID=990650 RepID=A0A0C9VMX7_SPHS4|nr:hypothetical protein M422DRAFT_253472 [Sphaerobolus stellatus SS14]